MAVATLHGDTSLEADPIERLIDIAAAELPRTGVETSVLALIGVLLLAAGGVLVALAGRTAGEVR